MSGTFKSVGYYRLLLLLLNVILFVQESRHAFGMRALGLPNTKHFHEITKIEDALARMYSHSSLKHDTKLIVLV